MIPARPILHRPALNPRAGLLVSPRACAFVVAALLVVSVAMVCFAAGVAYAHWQYDSLAARIALEHAARFSTLGDLQPEPPPLPVPSPTPTPTPKPASFPREFSL